MSTILPMPPIGGLFIEGTDGNDTLVGTTLADEIHGKNGLDQIFGDAGDDLLFGDAGNDNLLGGSGNDTLDGGVGADAMAGGTGNDTYIVDSAGDQVTENAGEGFDAVRTTLSNYTLTANVETLTFSGLDTGFTGTGNSIDNTIIGGPVDDVLNGGGGNDKLSGGDGHDTLTGGIGNDTLDGGALSDTASYANESGNLSIDLTTGIAERELRVFKVPTLERDTLISIENVEGGLGNDTITGNSTSNFLAGHVGNDILSGGAGNDILDGGVGDDSLIGGAGIDDLTGGPGNDTFVFAPGFSPGSSLADVIHDFDADPAGGQDRLDVRAFGITADTFTRVLIATNGTDTLIFIDHDPANEIELMGVAPSAVTINDFIF